MSCGLRPRHNQLSKLFFLREQLSKLWVGADRDQVGRIPFIRRCAPIASPPYRVVKLIVRISRASLLYWGVDQVAVLVTHIPNTDTTVHLSLKPPLQVMGNWQQAK
jgi:hypothetical protein